jgi:hypothetical protein
VYCPRHIVASVLLSRSTNGQHHPAIRLQHGLGSFQISAFGFGDFGFRLRTFVKHVAALPQHHRSVLNTAIIKEPSTSSIDTALTIGQRTMFFLWARKHQSSRSRSCTKSNGPACSQHSTHPIRLTNRSTRTLPPMATSSSTHSDFSSPSSAPQSAPPVNSIR